RRERLERNLSLVDLARKLNVSPKTLQRWEKGRNYPRPYERGKICEFFQLSAKEIGFLSPEAEVIAKRKRAASPAQAREATVPASQAYIVGRQEEVQLFEELLAGHTDYRWL